MKIKIGLIDDNSVCRLMLKNLLTKDENINIDVLFELETLLELPQLHHAFFYPDIIICDVEMPGINGIDGIPLIQKRFPGTKIIMCSSLVDTDVIVKSIAVGASGFIQKSFSRQELFSAVYHVIQGSVYVSPVFLKNIFDIVKFNKYEFECLTSREAEVADCILSGMSYKLIASRINVSENTVRDHIKRIYRKLNINSKGELHSLSRNRSLGQK